MALSQFNEEFQLRYQDVLSKELVSMKVATTELRSSLKFGDTVHRPKIDTSNLKVRDVTRYVDRTIPQISDADQTITIDKQKAVDFAMDQWDKLQAGPLSPEEKAGEIAADMLSQYIDADVFYQVRNAANKFDTGNLTGTSSNNTPIALSTSNAFQVPTQLFAFLRSHKIKGGNLVIVGDSYAASIFQQTIIGKNIDMAESVMKNGYSGPLVNFSYFVSENLTGEATLTSTGTFSDNDTVTIGGVTFTMKTTLGATAGNVLIGANAAASIANLVAAINGAAGAGSTYVELSAANRLTITDTLRITATATSATVMTIVGTGSGRLSLSKSAANWSWTTNFIHAYAGQSNAIDLVVQQDVELDIRGESKQKTDNYLTDALYGVKVFDDRAQRFVDLQISA
jgi:hypothetical protein